MKSRLAVLLALALAPLLLTGCAESAADLHTYYLSDVEAGRYGPHGRITQKHPQPRRAPAPATRSTAAHRGKPAPQGPPARRDHPQRVAARQHATTQYPVAKKAFQDGFVISPYTKAKINVQRVPHGAKVLDPTSEQVFINP